MPLVLPALQERQRDLERAWEEVSEAHEQQQAFIAALQRQLHELRRLYALRADDAAADTVRRQELERKAVHDRLQAEALKVQLATALQEVEEARAYLEQRQRLDTLRTRHGTGSSSVSANAKPRNTAGSLSALEARNAVRASIAADRAAVDGSSSSIVPAGTDVGGELQALRVQLQGLQDRLDEEIALRMAAEQRLYVVESSMQRVSAGRAKGNVAPFLEEFHDRDCSFSDVGESTVDKSLADELAAGQQGMENVITVDTPPPRKTVLSASLVLSDLQEMDMSFLQQEIVAAESVGSGIDSNLEVLVLRGELEELREELETLVGERETLLDSAQLARKDVREALEDAIEAHRTTAELHEALEKSFKERDSLQRRFLRRGKQLANLKRLLADTSVATDHHPTGFSPRYQTTPANAQPSYVSASPAKRIAESEKCAQITSPELRNQAGSVGLRRSTSFTAQPKSVGISLDNQATFTPLRRSASVTMNAKPPPKPSAPSISQLAELEIIQRRRRPSTSATTANHGT